MKYEIIKGSEKDFEGCADEILTIYRVKGGLYCQKTDKASSGVLLSAVGGCVSIIAERRPVAEPVVNQQLTTEWSGEGLPPVGVECEWLDNRESYVHVKIMYSSRDAIVIRRRSQAFNEDVDIPLDPVFEPARCKFRPIRSLEDVARSNIIGEMERTYEDLTGKPAREAEEYYDFIAAGKIPGITKTPTVSELMHVTESATREDCEAIIKMMGGIK